MHVQSGCSSNDSDVVILSLPSVDLSILIRDITGACPGFLKGEGIKSLGSLKNGHQILKGGVQWSGRGGPVH